MRRLSQEPGRSPGNGSRSRDETPVTEVDREVDNLIRLRNERRSRPRPPPIVPAEVVDISDDVDDPAERELEDLEDAELEKVFEFVDLTIEAAPRPNLSPARNPPMLASHDELRNYRHQGFNIRPGVVVELLESVGRYEIKFLIVRKIFQDRLTRSVAMRGIPLARTRYFKGMLQRKLNELCMVLEIEDGDARPVEEQAQLEVGLDNIMCPRTLRMTNASFGAHRFDRRYFRDNVHIEEYGELVCRWRLEILFRDAHMRKLGKAHEWGFSHLRYEDADVQYRIPNETRLNAWRGGKAPGGSSLGQEPRTIDLEGAVTISVDSDSDEDTTATPETQRQPGQMYTFADIFCGAGGTSRGAEMSGMKIICAVDKCAAACRTFQTNFPDAELHQMDVYDFIRGVATPRVDVLHLSPPCQVWSPAHTIAGQNDEDNIAVLFSSQGLVDKLRPRVFTLEQTFGILHPKHRPFFNSLIQGFTSLDYSVRWKIVFLSGWGLPQARKRLVLVGACPGERLPPFPRATHGEGPGLLPFVTAAQAIHGLDSLAGVTLHAHKPGGFERRPSWNADSILPRTITCSGGQNYHFSGLRHLTQREFACYQGFPAWHKFCAPLIKRQIGNAFPPCVVWLLYSHLKKWLEKEDGVVGAAGDDDLVPGTEEAQRRLFYPPSLQRVDPVARDGAAAQVGSNEALPVVIEDEDEEEPFAIHGQPLILIDDDDDDGEEDIQMFDVPQPEEELRAESLVAGVRDDIEMSETPQADVQDKISDSDSCTLNGDETDEHWGNMRDGSSHSAGSSSTDLATIVEIDPDGDEEDVRKPSVVMLGSKANLLDVVDLTLNE